MFCGADAADRDAHASSSATYGGEYPRLLRYNTRDAGAWHAGSVANVVDALCSALEAVAEDVETGARVIGAKPARGRRDRRALADEERRLDKLLELFYAEAITVSEFKSRGRDASEESAVHEVEARRARRLTWTRTGFNVPDARSIQDPCVTKASTPRPKTMRSLRR